MVGLWTLSLVLWSHDAWTRWLLAELADVIRCLRHPQIRPHHCKGHSCPNEIPQAQAAGKGVIMTEAKPVHITFLLDRSGSMSDLHADVVGGFNAYLNEQKALPGKARLTLVQFDSQATDVVRDAVKLPDVPAMLGTDFQPRGGTPLLDAIGKVVNRVQARIDERKAQAKKDEVILVVIYTDGQENASREFSKDAIKALVETKTAEGWTFAYMGSDLNAYGEAGSLGFMVANTSTFDSSSAGTHAAYASLSGSTSSLRSAANIGVAPDATDFYQGDKSAETEPATTPSK